MREKEVLVLLPDSPYSDWIIQKAKFLTGTKCDFVCFSGKRQFIKSTTCKFLEVGSNEYKVFFKTKLKYDRVVIHYHNPETGYFIEKFRIDSEKLVWVLWSGDLYNSKFFKKPLYFRKNLAWKEANSNEIETKSRLKEWLKSKLGKVNSFDYQKSFQRIKYIGSSFPHDVEAAEITFGKSYSLIPHSILSINQLFDVDSFSSIQSSGNKLLMGHSGALENNHLDALDFLNGLGITQEILCPLSYGEESYIKSVISAGADAFGEKFLPLTKFLPKHEYYKLLSEVGFAVFFLRVQQAFGNILGLLFLGVKIFLPNENAIFIDLTEKGFLLFSLDDLSLEAVGNILNEEDRLRNRSLVLQFYSEAEVAESYERMYLGSMNSGQ